MTATTATTNNPANLKPGSTLRVRAVQKVTVMGNKDKDIEPDILVRLGALPPSFQSK